MSKSSDKPQIIALCIAIVAVFSFSLLSDAPSNGTSVELGVSELSPSGLSGGKIIPASCPSDLHDEPSYGQSCFTSYACGTTGGAIQCGGACSAPNPNPPNYGAGCNATNVCGQSNAGTITCSGACSATPPPAPSNYGNACTGPANSCGLRSFGSIGCSNNCSAQFAPPESQCQTVNTETTGTTLTASPSTTGINGYSDLSWQSDQSSCSLYNPANGQILATSTSGTLRVGPLPSATRYILTCGGKTVTITVRTDFRFNEF